MKPNLLQFPSVDRRRRKNKICRYFVFLLFFQAIMVRCVLLTPFGMIQVNNFSKQIAMDVSEEEFDILCDTVDSWYYYRYMEGLHYINLKLSTNCTISNVRYTNDGYYAVIKNDDRRLYIFFDRLLFYRSFVVTDVPFRSRKNVKKVIEIVPCRKTTAYLSKFVPLFRLNTSSTAYAMYYKDGVDIVLYTSNLPECGFITKPKVLAGCNWDCGIKKMIFDLWRRADGVPYILSIDRH